MVLLICQPSPGETEAGGSGVQGQSGIHRETLSGMEGGREGQRDGGNRGREKIKEGRKAPLILYVTRKISQHLAYWLTCHTFPIAENFIIP